MYSAYNSKFFNTIKENTSIESTYEAFKDTAWHERYLLNAYQFSAAKDLSETKAMQDLVFKSSGFKDFKEKASEITNINNDQWLRVEMDVAKRNTVMGENWRKMEETKDLYPYWVYKTENDGNVRPEHAALEGVVFRIGDPEGDSCHPICDWGCRCHSEPADDQYLKEENKTVSKGSDYLNEDDPKTGKPYIGEDFRFNPGKQGAMPNDSSYSEVFSSANKGNAELFKNEHILTNEDYEKIFNGKFKDEFQYITFDNPDDKVLKAYTGNLFADLNKFLRNGSTDEEVLLTEKALNKSLDRFPDFKGTTYRSMRLNESQSMEFINNLQKDKQVEFLGFTSTNANGIPGRFLGENGKIVLEIESKTGKNIVSFTKNENEAEVLFKSKSKFEYISYEKVMESKAYDWQPDEIRFFKVKLKEL